jgi:hypothetical protein
MWPNFMPAQGTTPASRDMRPAFANVAGKYFLKQSSWAGSSTKLITYRLFHMFGDAFQWFYSEVPMSLSVTHNPMVAANATTFDVTADAGSFIALTIPSPTGPIIVGTATGTGSAVSIPLSQAPTSTMLVTVTKQNYRRYGAVVNIGIALGLDAVDKNLSLSCFPNPFNELTTIRYSLDKASSVSILIYDMTGKEVVTLMRNEVQASGNHQVQLNSKEFAPGVYSCVLKTNDNIAIKNLIVSEKK